MTDPVDLDQLCNALESIKAMRDKAETGIKNIQGQLTDQLNALGSKTVTTRSGRKITLVESTSTSWDEKVIRDIIGPQLWEEVTRQVLDPAKLEAVVEREKIPPSSLKDAVVETPRASYIRVTAPKKKGPKQEE